MKNHISLKAVSLSKSFGSLKAVDNLSFEVPSGTVFSLLGINGAGKTTAIRMLTGLLAPDSGTGEICSHPIGSSAAKVSIGYSPQETSTAPNLTVAENLIMTAGLFGLENPKDAAEEIMEKQLCGKAAICSADAARLYGMRVLEDSIEDNKHNFTRFLVVADPWQVDELSRHRNKEVNKASMVFTLPHTEGSLSQVLSILSFYRINLTKIQSLPIIGREWEYQFYVDVVFDNVLKYKQSIVAITPLTKELKILGEYEDGKSNI